MQNTPGCLTGRGGPGPSSNGRSAVTPRVPRGAQGAYRNSGRREASQRVPAYPTLRNVDTAACAPARQFGTRLGKHEVLAELCGLQHDHAEIGEFACNGRLAALKVQP